MLVTGEGSQSAPRKLGHVIIGDNVDGKKKARFVRKGIHHDETYHYFHFYGVQNRIDLSSFPDVHPHTCMVSPQMRIQALLPSKEDDAVLRNEFVTLVSRILTDNLSYFQHTFDGSVQWHIEHRYYAEMSKKSDVVCICSYQCSLQIAMFGSGATWSSHEE